VGMHGVVRNPGSTFTRELAERSGGYQGVDVISTEVTAVDPIVQEKGLQGEGGVRALSISLVLGGDKKCARSWVG